MRVQLLRFLLVGSANTVLTSVLFYGLASVLPARVAFTIVYLGGLAFVTISAPRYVFRVHAPRSRLGLLALWYIGIYVVGLVVVSALDSIFESRAVIVVGTVLVTAPLGFAGARLFVGRAPVSPLTTMDRPVRS